MKKVSVLIPAKINLTLDVVGNENSYHKLKSLVSSVSVYDKITLKKYKNGIVFIDKGNKSKCNVLDNNAYKTAKILLEKYKISGIKIILKKNIPVGAGLGGSSADIAGVIKAFSKLYDIKDDLKPVADSLGSDSGYMLTGGFSVIENRGEVITKINVKRKFYVLIYNSNNTVSTKECFSVFDKENKTYKSSTDNAVKNLESGNVYKFLKNDLQNSAEILTKDVKKRIDLLKNGGAKEALLTGSGSAVYGLFEDKGCRDKCYSKLKKSGIKNLIKCETL